ncbi:MAG: redoxin domain-containing protein [Ignavibacteria bacterium]
MRKVLLPVLIILITVSCTQKEPLTENALDKVKSLYKEEKYETALNLLNRIIEEQGEDYSKVTWQFNILSELGKYEQALEAALKKEKLSERKSPWRNMDIVFCYLKLNNNKQAMKWFEDAVDRGFNSLSTLEEEPFDKLTELEGFEALEKRIKDLVGIGCPTKDFTLTNLEGEEITLSKMKDKVVMIDFWATWCPPCREEIPNLVDIYNEHNKNGFEIIGISLDNKDAETKIKEFMEEYGIQWQITYSGDAWYDKTVELYGVNSIPSVWLVDKKGNLRYFDIHGDELKEKISELVAEKI